MRTSINPDQDALLGARKLAQGEPVSMADASSWVIRRGARAGAVLDSGARAGTVGQGRFALLPPRDEIIEHQHVRDLMEREGV